MKLQIHKIDNESYKDRRSSSNCPNSFQAFQSCYRRKVIEGKNLVWYFPGNWGILAGHRVDRPGCQEIRGTNWQVLGKYFVTSFLGRGLFVSNW